MWQLEKCLVENDLSVLVEQGEASAEQISEAWANLFYEYCDLIESTETKYRARLIAEISLEKRRNEVVQDWINILSVMYSEHIAAAVRLVGYDFELNPGDEEQYLADLTRIGCELSTARLHVRIKEAELSAILENQSTQDSIGDRYFATMYFRINNYAKREAVNGQTFVQDYCAALRDFVSYNKSLSNAGI